MVKLEIIIFTLTVFIFLFKPLFAEVVFLKDGSIISGEIISDSATSIYMRDNEKKRREIKRSDIMRILYTKLKMGKIYIQKRDGKGIVAYMVDEDQDSYTFRLDLFKPEEFTIKRSAVLFIAEKNPSGLQVSGEIKTDKISLVWEPPYDKVKRYNIYIKKNDKDKYGLIDTSKEKSITIKNLSSNTAYFIIVTSVDGDDYESPPSNELQIKTKNIPPTEPSGIVRGMSGNSLSIKWNPSEDIDGKVVMYRVYGIRNDKREMISELKKNEYILKYPESFDKIEIVAVDDSGDESSSASVRFLPRGFTMKISGGTIIPLGNFEDLAGRGYGTSLNLAKQHIFIDKIEAGFTVGFYYLAGEEDSHSEIQKTDYALFIPLMLDASYRFNFTENLFTSPYLSVGAAYLDIPYTEQDSNTLENSEKHLMEFGPAAGAGISAGYSFDESLDIGFLFGYGLLLNKEIFDYPFLQLELFAGVHF